MSSSIKELIKNVNNIYHYLLGNYRLKLFYSEYGRYLIRKHILEQIEFRMKVMDRECWNKGECKMCGCETPALQMANKPCDKPCYPEMLSKTAWKSIGKLLIDIHHKDERLYNQIIRDGKLG